MNFPKPQMEPNKYKTYSISRRLESHFRPAHCHEVDCPAYGNGWVTTVDEATPLGQKQAGYIRTQSGRWFTETRTAQGLTEFRFPGGQTCFEQHYVSLEREPTYLVRGGDYRHYYGYRTHDRPEWWVEDFAEHQDHLKKAQR